MSMRLRYALLPFSETLTYAFDVILIDSDADQLVFSTLMSASNVILCASKTIVYVFETHSVFVRPFSQSLRY